MRGGRLQQFDQAEEIYDRPCNVFVAGFVGSPPMNFVEGELARVGDRLGVVVGGRTVTLDDSEIPRDTRQLGRQVILGVRPERLEEPPPGSDAARRMTGVVTVRDLGSYFAEHFPKEALNLPPDHDQLMLSAEGA